MLAAADVMTKDVVTVAPDQPVREIARLLQQHRISGVPVVDEHRHVIGIVSEADLIGHSDVVGEQHRSWWLSLLSDEGMSARDYVRTHGRRARDIMASDVATVGEDASVAAIARTLKQH